MVALYEVAVCPATNCVVRKKLPTPRSGAHAANDAQLSSQVPVLQRQSGSFEDARSTRFFPSRSVCHASNEFCAERSTSSRCNLRVPLASQKRCVPSSER